MNQDSTTGDPITGLLYKYLEQDDLYITLLLFSCWVVSDSLWSHEFQASLPFTISQSLLKLMSIELVMPCNHLILCQPLLSCLQSFPASGFFFPVSQLFTYDGQRVGVFASASMKLQFPMNIQSWFPLGLTGLVSLQSKSLSRVFSSTRVQKQQFFSTQPSLWSNSHIHTWLLEKS